MRWRQLDAGTLARQAGIAASNLSAWQRTARVPSAETCRALARALGVPVLIVLHYAGHLSVDELSLVIEPGTGQQFLAFQDMDAAPGAARELLPLPAEHAPLSPDPVARAKQAILAIPDGTVPPEAKLRLVALLETQVAAAEIAAELEQGHVSPPSR